MMKPQPLIWQSHTINENKCFYENIADDAGKWFETLKYDEGRKRKDHYLQEKQKSNWFDERWERR